MFVIIKKKQKHPFFFGIGFCCCCCSSQLFVVVRHSLLLLFVTVCCCCLSLFIVVVVVVVVYHSLLLFFVTVCCCSSQFVVVVVVVIVRCWSLEVNVDYLSLLFLVCLLVRLHCCCTSILFVVIVVAQKRLVSTNSGGYPNNMTIRGVSNFSSFSAHFRLGRCHMKKIPSQCNHCFKIFTQRQALQLHLSRRLASMYWLMILTDQRIVTDRQTDI